MDDGLPEQGDAARMALLSVPSYNSFDSQRVMRLMEDDLQRRPDRLGDDHLQLTYTKDNQRCTTEIEYDVGEDASGIQRAHVSILTRRRPLPAEQSSSHSHCLCSADVDDDIQEIVEEHEGTLTSDHGIVERFWTHRTHVTHFHGLPDWLQDNEHLHTGHRLPLPDAIACIRSVFSLHTETLNIWTHLIGCVAFMAISGWFVSRPAAEVGWQQKVVFSLFFISAIICMGCSAAYHTMNAHSPNVSRMFAKLDYVGIAILIVGSFIPWIFYGFYCRSEPKIVYMAMIALLGAGCILCSLNDAFNQARLRPMRAGVFTATGLSGLIPGIHFVITDGYQPLWRAAGFQWMLLMGSLYILGAACYAARVPERFFPGKFDIWFHSHQIFHLFVIAAALVHFVGISEMADHRLSADTCAAGAS